MEVSHGPEIAHQEVEVDFPPKAPIKCLYSARYVGDLDWIESKNKLIFTHGAGGTLKSDAIANFTHGFVSLTTRPTMLCFQGNMNLKSRVKMFTAIIEFRGSRFKKDIETSPACLGGRSLGARAAVMAAGERTTHLILVSYPLHTDRELRDKILLDLPESVKVLFISGDKDAMCDLDRLDEVRKNMKCKTWKILVQNADHGMTITPKPGTERVGKMTGAIAGTWLDNCVENCTEGSIFWDPDNEASQWSGWSAPKISSKLVAGRVKSGVQTVTSENSKRKIASINRKRKDKDEREVKVLDPSGRRKRIKT